MKNLTITQIEKKRLQIDRDCAYLEMDSIIKLLIINIGVIILVCFLLHYFFKFEYIYISISLITTVFLNIKNFKKIYDLNKEISNIDTKINEL